MGLSRKFTPNGLGDVSCLNIVVKRVLCLFVPFLVHDYVVVVKPHGFVGWLLKIPLTPTDFIQPLFVVEGENVRDPIASLPGIERLSCDVLVETAQQVFQ